MNNARKGMKGYCVVSTHGCGGNMGDLTQMCLPAESPEEAAREATGFNGEWNIEVQNQYTTIIRSKATSRTPTTIAVVVVGPLESLPKPRVKEIVITKDNLEILPREACLNPDVQCGMNDVIGQLRETYPFGVTLDIVSNTIIPRRSV